MSEQATSKLNPGTVLASRYQIETLLGSGGLGEIYRGVDQQRDDDPVAIRRLADALQQDAVITAQIEEQVELTRGLRHKNVVQTHAMVQEDGATYLVTELVEGQSLRDLIAKKAQANKPFSPKGTYNVVAHICNALEKAHPDSLHGLPGPGSVLVSKAGRVKVGDFGLLPAFLPGSPVQQQMADAAILAPELLDEASSVTAAADIYTLGALIYWLLTGKAPETPGAPPSAEVSGLSEGLDQLVARCMAASPEERLESVQQVKTALYNAISPASSADPPKDPANISANSLAPPPLPPAAVGEAPAAKAQTPPAAEAEASAQTAKPDPTPAQASSGSPFQLAPNAAAPAPAPAQVPGGAMNQAAPTLTVEEMLAQDDGDPSERWLVQKDNLDFGPFALGDLKEQIYKKQFSGNDMVVDQDTGKRFRIRNLPELRDFIVAAERHFANEAQQQAEMERWEKEKRRRTMTVLIVAVGLVVLGAGGAVAAYLMTREPETRERIVYRDNTNKELAKLLANLEVTWKKEPPEQVKARKKARRRRRPRTASAAAAGSGGGGEDVTRLGDVSQGGGDALLSQKVIQSVMQQNFKRLVPCVYGELRRNASMRTISIDFNVKGNGQVSYAKVNGKTDGPFQSCIYGKMRAIKFPAFDGAVTRASFSMSIK